MSLSPSSVVPLMLVQTFMLHVRQKFEGKVIFYPELIQQPKWSNTGFSSSKSEVQEHEYMIKGEKNQGFSSQVKQVWHS